MRCVRVLVCAAGALVCTWARADFDAIGGSSASTIGAFWLTSATNTDTGGDVTTACGVGPVVVPAGHTVTEIQAVVGTRGPGGAGLMALSSVSGWHVEFWSSEAAFGAAPAAGNVRSIIFAAPTNPDFATPYGTDISGRPTYLVKFRVPGGIAVPQTGNAYFAIRIDASQTNTGSLGVLESTATGPSGLWASQGLSPPGYLPFSSLLVHAHAGVFAYKVVAGCPSDYNGDGFLSAQDIFDFLNAWFAQDPGADFNGMNSISAQDIFDFLNAWFGGC